MQSGFDKLSLSGVSGAPGFDRLSLSGGGGSALLPLSLSLSKAFGTLIQPDLFIAVPIFLRVNARNGSATLRAGGKKG